MPGRVVIDAGPLVALFDGNDQHHPPAMRFIQTLRDELVSNLAVVTETAYLLSFSLKAQTDFLTWVRDGALTLVETELADFERIIELMQKYADRPMDFTDASLVTLCERLGVRDVASVDRDFTIYRYRNRETFRNRFIE